MVDPVLGCHSISDPFEYYPICPPFFQVVSFLQISPHKNLCMHLSCPPYVPHALPISLIWSPKKYSVSSTDYKAPHYVVVSTPMLPRPPPLLSDVNVYPFVTPLPGSEGSAERRYVCQTVRCHSPENRSLRRPYVVHGV